MLRLALLVTLTAMVVSCAQPSPLQGVDLPAASLPDEIEPGMWAVSFTHRFGEGFWQRGPHTYAMELECDAIIDVPMTTGERGFSSIPGAPTFELVYLRPSGLGTTVLGPTGLAVVDPGQATVAVITVVGISNEDDARAAIDCQGSVRVDGDPAMPLSFQEPFRP